MEDFESAALGLKNPAAKAKSDKYEHLPLSYAELSILAQAPNSQFYNVVLRVMEGELEKLETEHMAQWKEKEKFERSGLVAVAARVFYERIQREINFHVSEFMGNEEARQEEEKAKQMSAEELVRREFGLEGL
ncbi:MAG: hypothetical protein ACREQ5_06855 [Candidatus Dormibacteria bacterium]